MGLGPPLRFKLKKQVHKSLQTGIGTPHMQAGIVRDDGQEIQGVDNWERSLTIPSSKGRCYLCIEMGHQVSLCPNNTENQG